MKRQFTKGELKLNRHYTKFRTNLNYVTINYVWCVRFNLSLLEVVVMKIINDCNKYVKGVAKYTGSIEKLCTITNTTAPTMRKTLQKLDELGFIERQEEKFTDKQGNTKNWVTYKSHIDLSEEEKSIEEQLDIELARREAMQNSLRLRK